MEGGMSELVDTLDQESGVFLSAAAQRLMKRLGRYGEGFTRGVGPEGVENRDCAGFIPRSFVEALASYDMAPSAEEPDPGS
jgi:hypothetical protein